VSNHHKSAGIPEEDSTMHPEVVAKPRSRRVARVWPLVSGSAALLLAVALGVVIAMRHNGSPFALDTSWMADLAESRAPIWDFLAGILNVIGGGVIATFVVPLILVAVLWRVHGWWAAGYYFAASLLTGGLAQLLKHLFGRARPGEIAVTVDFGSFPSGHVANAAVTAAVLAILFPRVWVWLAGTLYTAAMMLSRTYLGAHWVSDTVGAVLLGVGVAVVMWAPAAAKLDGERKLTRDRSLVPERVRKWGRVLLLADTWRKAHENWIVDVRVMPRSSRLRLVVAALVFAIVGAIGFTVVLVNVLAASGATHLDLELYHWFFGQRTPVLTAVMIGLAVFFGPVGLPLIVLIVTVVWGIVRKHAWRPLLLAGAMLTGVIVAQLIGHTVGRDRPPISLMMFGPDATFSFPSGHVLGASDFMLVGTYLVVSRCASIKVAVMGFFVAAVCIVAAMLSRVYLGYHWTTDALASFSLSLIVLAAVIALDTWRTVRVPGQAPSASSAVRAEPAAP
jgi:undecaprenyl-diphosphatase